MLATGDWAKKTTIYDSKSKTKTHEFDHETVLSVCFSPDGSMLATGDWYNKTIVYNVNTKTKIHEWEHDFKVFSVCFSPKQEPETWESYNKESLYVYSAEELQRWLNTNKGYHSLFENHKNVPL